MTEKSLFSSHGIKDNHTRGKVADFLQVRLIQGSRLSVVSAYFTIYAYEALRKELDGIDKTLNEWRPIVPETQKPRPRCKSWARR